MTTRQLKRALTILATGLALFGAGAAHAGYYDYWGGYHPTCGNVFNPYVFGGQEWRCY